MTEPLEAQPLGDDQLIAAQDFCRACRLEMATLVELVELGVVTPRGSSPDAWLVPATSLARLRVASRLMHDLGVNVSGVALALELLDARRELERRVRLLERLTVDLSGS
jgi:chaperone modulatory protein CbpM